MRAPSGGRAEFFSKNCKKALLGYVYSYVRYVRLLTDTNGGKSLPKREKDWAYVSLPLAMLAALLVAAAFTGMWPWDKNAYHSYTLQACAWLEGRLDLGEDYPWLELAIVNDKYYVSFPPFPSYVLLPFAAVFGVNTPDHFISLASTLIGVVYAVRMYKLVCRQRHSLDFFVLYLFLCNGYFFIAMRGYVWFLAQSLCFTLSLMALVHALCGQGGISLTCWACAVGCRPMMVFCAPVLLVLLWKSYRQANPDATPIRLLKSKWYWLIGPCLLAISYMTLNLLRFGNPLEFGHRFLPEFTRAAEGQFSLSYVKKNLSDITRLPTVDPKGGALKFYTHNGNAFWLISPILISFAAAFVYAMIKKRRECVFELAAIPVVWLVYTAVVCMHRTMGGWQFGNRYMQDMMPYLYYGLLRLKPEGENFKKLNMPLFVLGFALNLVGAVATYNEWI